MATRKALLREYGRDADTHWKEVMKLPYMTAALIKKEHPKPVESCWASQKGAKWVRFDRNPAYGRK